MRGAFLNPRSPGGALRAIASLSAFLQAAMTAFVAILSIPHSMNAQLIGPFVGNNYNYVQPGMPNYGIAQGSIFSITGAPTNMTESTASQSVPLQTTLAGVTVAVTVGNLTTQAIPYYVSPGQITAILPSQTPVGAATITVTSGGMSVSGSTTVVPSAFGMATVSTPSGQTLLPWSAALAQDDSEGGQLLSQTNAANPGEYLTLWGSGLGPVSGDETQYQIPANLTNIPIEVDIGGVSATVTYHGRSIYPGVDQINVMVPPGVSGCNVSVAVTAGGVVSNFATIPVAASGRICSDPGLLPLTTSEYQTLLGLANVNIGAISLTTLTTASPGTAAATSDSAYATFQKYTAQQFVSNSFLQVPSIGSCMVTATGWKPPITGSTSPGQLNAGPQIDLNGPDGALTLLQYPGSGTYLEPSGTSPAIVPPAGGTFTFDNGSGGPDVGAFKSSLSESLTSPLVWTNASATAAIDRGRGQLVTWTGGIPGSYVYIFGYSYINLYTPLAVGQAPSYVYFTCSAPLSAGQFTVPAAVLESLPPAGAALSPGLTPTFDGYLYVSSGSIQQFSAPGLDLGLLFFGAGSGISVPFN
jgi:uncharacterized protein (TIGR03437 family)